jgi:hypothetical protein
MDREEDALWLTGCLLLLSGIYGVIYQFLI